VSSPAQTNSHIICINFPHSIIFRRRKSQEWEQQESTQQYQQQATHGYAPYNIPSSPSMMPMPPPPPPPHHNPSEQQQNNQQANSSELTVTLSSGQAAPGHPAAMRKFYINFCTWKNGYLKHPHFFSANENKPRKPSMLPVPA
jgi:hypothetical protein